MLDASNDRSTSVAIPKPRRFDIALACVAVVAMCAEVWLTPIPGTRWLLTLCAVVQGTSLAWRTIAPCSVMLLQSVCIALPQYFGTDKADSGTLALLGLVIAVYAVGRYGLRERANPKFAYASLLVALMITLIANIAQAGLAGSDALYVAMFFVVPFVLGRAISVSRHDERVAVEEAARVRFESEAARDQAVEEERERIARELHDVIAHSVSLMGLQAGAVRKILPPDSGQLESTLRSIENTGRDTLSELRRMLGIMRQGSANGDQLAPQPGLAALGALVENVRASGQQVELTVGPGLEDLSPGVDLAAYRIVQEALTNSLRHSPDAPVTVSVGAPNGNIELAVISAIEAAPQQHQTEFGHGILGMKERAALYDGRVNAGFQAGRGFVVDAVLPAEYLPIDDDSSPAIQKVAEQ